MSHDAAYQHMASRYDTLFRLNPEAVAFVAQELGGLSGRRIVDAGCGTGTFARALAQEGARVMGVDLDPTLLAQAAPKAAGPAPFRLQEADLRTFEVPPDLAPLDAVLCLGNTLPHLPDPAAVLAFLRHARAHLAPGGRLVVQTVGYDRVLDQSQWDLPSILREDLAFERHYDPRPDGRLDFTTTLRELPEGPVHRSTHPLLPLRAATLVALAGEAGFGGLQAFGGFQRIPYTPEAPALVLVGRAGTGLA